MYKCDALINLADQIEESSYCYIINLDTNKNKACVRVGENHHLSDGDNVIIESYDDIKGVLLHQGTVSRTTSDEAFIHRLSLINEKQRRFDVRVNVNIPLVLKGISRGITLTKVSKKAFLETLNVSASGMLLKSDLDIEDKTCLIYDFPLESKMLSCKARILRVQIENDYYIYGCRLLNDENDRAELRKFVYKTQIKQKKVNFDLD